MPHVSSLVLAGGLPDSPNIYPFQAKLIATVAHLTTNWFAGHSIASCSNAKGVLKWEGVFWQDRSPFMEISSRPAARLNLMPSARAQAPTSTRTVFLVHSAPRPLSPVRAALQDSGYDVIYADSVEAALRLWIKLSKPVDLFLADIMLGKDPGVEQLVKLLQAENPRLRVLYANDLETPTVVHSYPQQLVSIIQNCLA